MSFSAYTTLRDGSIVRTQQLPPSHKPWTPLPYMKRAVKYLVDHHVAGLPLAPGGRKTSITLAGFRELQKAGRARSMLVIAPLRVCRVTWPDEIAKWSDFRDLSWVLLHGPKKKERLREPADIYLINPEGIPWLTRQYFGRQLPFDVVTIDELTRFKNAQSARSQTLRPCIARTPFKWGLTGSLKPNTHEDVFGMQLMLDSGQALGQYITHFRRNYCYKSEDGFGYEIIPGAEKRIAERLAPSWFYMDPKDYAQLPPLVEDRRSIVLEPKAQAAYDSMKKSMVANLSGATITAENAGACYSKLSQMANGAVYDEARNVHELHDAKIDAVGELLDELDGAPLLLAYEFNHDIDRIRARFQSRLPNGELPFLGKGTSAKDEKRWIEAWNRNELPLLCVHPASAGHGLNLQEGFCAHVGLFSIPWDWELFDQFIRRVRRSGNEAQRIFLHLLLIHGSIDFLKLAAMVKKDTGQAQLLQTLNEAILGDESQAQWLEGIQPLTFGEDDMNQPVDKLPRGDQGGPAPQAGAWGQGVPQQHVGGPQPNQTGGWGQPAPQGAPQQPPQASGQAQQTWGQPAQQPPQQAQADMFQQQTGVPPQQGGGWGTPQGQQLAQEVGAQHPQGSPQQATEAMITPPPQQQAPAGFSPAVGQQMGQIMNNDYDAAPAAAREITQNPENRQDPNQQQGQGGWGMQPPPQPAAQDTGWQQPQGAPSAADIRKMKVAEVEEAAQRLGIGAPKGWSGMKADEKKEWLIGQVYGTEDTAGPAEQPTPPANQLSGMAVDVATPPPDYAREFALKQAVDCYGSSISPGDIVRAADVFLGFLKG